MLHFCVQETLDMDKNGRANHIEDYLVTVRTGQWFGKKEQSQEKFMQI